MAATLPAVLSARWKRGYSASMAGSLASTRIAGPSKGHSERHPPSDPCNQESSEVESVSCRLAT